MSAGISNQCKEEEQKVQQQAETAMAHLSRQKKGGGVGAKQTKE